MSKGTNIVRASECRVCRSCCHLVTTAAECPLCGKPTKPHRECKITEGYCTSCAEGPFPADKMHVKTWDEDPYCQVDDGTLLILVCEPCRRAEEEEE